MPVLPILTGRKADAPVAPPESSTTTTSSAAIFAGGIIGVFILLFLVFWLVNTGVPWYKRARSARHVRRNALMDQKAVLSSVPVSYTHL